MSLRLYELRPKRFVSGAPGDEKKIHPGGRKNNFFDRENDVRWLMIFEKYRPFLWPSHLKSLWTQISLGLAWKLVIDGEKCMKITLEENKTLMRVWKRWGKFYFELGGRLVTKKSHPVGAPEINPYFSGLTRSTVQNGVNVIILFLVLTRNMHHY